MDWVPVVVNLSTHLSIFGDDFWGFWGMRQAIGVRTDDKSVTDHRGGVSLNRGLDQMQAGSGILTNGETYRTKFISMVLG